MARRTLDLAAVAPERHDDATPVQREPDWRHHRLARCSIGREIDQRVPTKSIERPTVRIRRAHHVAFSVELGEQVVERVAEPLQLTGDQAQTGRCLRRRDREELEHLHTA